MINRMAMGFSLDVPECEEYAPDVVVGMFATLLNQPPSVIRKEAYRDLEAVMMVKQAELQKMEHDGPEGGHKKGYPISWQKIS